MGAELAGQVAIVTGAGRGIGRAISISLAEAGAAVTCLARTESELQDTVDIIVGTGGRAQAVVCDVSDPATPEHVLGVTEAWAGPVDLLVNNAGVLGPVGWFADTDVDEWTRCLDINFGAVARLSRAVAEGMVERGRGRIVNVSSFGAGAPGIPPLGVSAYLVSKTALARFTEVVAAELQPHGVFAFAVDPGGVYTAMTEEGASSPAPVPAPARLATLRDGSGIPAETVAGFCLQLACGDADSLTGLQLRYDADLTALTDTVEEVRGGEALTLRFRSEPLLQTPSPRRP